MVTRSTGTLLEEEDGKVRDTASLGKAQYIGGETWNYSYICPWL